MQALLILCCGLCLASALTYYVLYGLTKMLEALMKNSGQSLKTVFILITLTGLIYLIINRNDSTQMLQEVTDFVTFWEETPELDYGEQFDWQANTAY